MVGSDGGLEWLTLKATRGPVNVEENRLGPQSLSLSVVAENVNPPPDLDLSGPGAPRAKATALGIIHPAQSLTPLDSH